MRGNDVRSAIHLQATGGDDTRGAEHTAAQGGEVSGAGQAKAGGEASEGQQASKFPQSGDAAPQRAEGEGTKDVAEPLLTSFGPSCSSHKSFGRGVLWSVRTFANQGIHLRFLHSRALLPDPPHRHPVSHHGPSCRLLDCVASSSQSRRCCGSPLVGEVWFSLVSPIFTVVLRPTLLPLLSRRTSLMERDVLSQKPKPRSRNWSPMWSSSAPGGCGSKGRARRCARPRFS